MHYNTHLRESKCILPSRNPGKVKKAPISAQVMARQILKVTLDAGPLGEEEEVALSSVRLVH